MILLQELMMVSYKSLVCAGLAAIILAPLILAQEEMPPAGRGGGQGGRGGRGGRGPTREFLGLGPAPDEAAAKKGEPLYKQYCSTCHGQNARGAQGPNLVRSVVVLHDEKGEEIGPVIKNGKPAAGMPGFPALSQDDLYNIAQYLHLQVELTANRGTYGATYGALRNQISGDARKGEAFFNGSCKSCHSATGDLAKVGAKYPQAAALQSRFLWPATPAAETATVTTPSGQKITGTIRRLSDFDVSLTDANGEYHSWPRNRVSVHIEDKLAGHRALLPKYTDADIHNVTAYLVTLK
jgi:mono/diheme cytochrome c family protein